MSDKELNAALNHLKEAIEKSPSLNTGTKERLIQISSELRQTLDNSEQKETSEGDLAGRLKEMTEEFEQNHPDLTAIISRISAALSNMGI